jgi:hypothetical protein
VKIKVYRRFGSLQGEQSAHARAGHRATIEVSCFFAMRDFAVALSMAAEDRKMMSWLAALKES